MKQSESHLWPASASPAPAMCGESERARVLAAYGLGELEDDPELAAICRFAAQLCQTPLAAVSIVEESEQRFVAHEGMQTRTTPRSTSFCATAMLGGDVMVVPDATQDPRFAEFALVVGEPHIRFYAGAPLVSIEGAPVGSMCVIDTVPHPGGLEPLQRQGLEVLAQAVMRRLTGRRSDMANLRAIRVREQRLFRMIEGLPDVAWSADAAGNFDFFNSRWRDVTGKAPPSTAEEWREFIHPDDQETAFASWFDSLDRHVPFEAEYRFRQADGGWRWVLSRGLPVSGKEDRDGRWFGTLTDIDDGHRESENRDLLARELSHRIKNIFAVVTGLVALRARRRPEVAEFAEELNGTIRALGRAHDYVRPLEGRKGDSLTGLLHDLMAPYAAGEDGRVAVTGDECPIGPRAATPLALVFHELATNSAKYGALSRDEGTVSLTIARDADQVRMDWRESGGPPPQEGASGFGSRLVEMAVSGQLNGTIKRNWEAGGLQVELVVPLESIGS